MRKSILCCVLAATFLSCARLWAGPHNVPAGIPARIWATGNIVSGQTGDMNLFGTFLNPNPSVGGDLSRLESTSTGLSGAVGVNLGQSTNGVVRLEPSKVYVLGVGGTNLGTGTVNIVAPPGYDVIIDGTPRTRGDFNGAWSFFFQMVPTGEGAPSKSGNSSAAGVSVVEWHVALGNLSNGTDAGDITLSDAGNRTTWAPLFASSMLNFESDSNEVWIYRTGALRQVVTKQVAVDIYTPGGGAYYEIRYYDPSQCNMSTTPATFTGTPFMTYRIQQSAGGGESIDIIRTTQDVTTSSVLSGNRVDTMTITRSSLWPTPTWTRSNWTRSGGSAVSETEATSSGSGGSRTSESVIVQPAGGSSPTVSAQRTYTTISGLGEVTATETLGTGGNAMTTSYDYYTNTSNPGSLGFVKSVTYPTGSWMAQEYYDDTTTTTRSGKVKYLYRPFINSPGSVAFLTGSGEVTYYEYVNDLYGAQRRTSLIQKKLNNVETSKTEFSYNDLWVYANGQTITRMTRTDYAMSSSTLTTIVDLYRPDGNDPFYRSQLYGVSAPDGVQKSFAYEKGNWSAGTFTPSPSGTATRVSEITGSTNSSAGTLVSAFNGETIPGVYVVNGKSTRETLIRDARAQVVRREIYVWSSGAWVLTGWTNLTYDMAGQMVQRQNSDGGLYTATYTYGFLTSETAENGVTSDYTYDDGGRLETVTRQGSGGIGAIVVKYTYDSAGHRTQETVGWGQTETIVASSTYDDAGRLSTETAPGLSATTHSYNLSSRTHTVTRSDGATMIESSNLDGELASVTGTGVVAQYRTYGVDGNGTRFSWMDIGSSSSPRWTKQWTDWLGRSIWRQRPGYSGQVDTVEQFFYDGTTGKLTKATLTGYADRLYEYNYLGQLNRWGTDINGNGTLDLASSDRINETDTSLETISSEQWLRTDSRIYAAAGSGTATSTGYSRVRLTGHPANRLMEAQSVDAEGNQTTAVFDVNRSARTSLRTETKTGITGSRTISYINGLPITDTNYDGVYRTIGYDGLLRQESVEEKRNANTSTIAYVTGTMRPASVTDAASKVVAYGYDSIGRLAWQRDQRNFYTHYAYNTRDQLLRQWGDGAYPIEYSYDSTYGDLLTLSTFRGGSGWDGSTWPSGTTGTADTTTWAYDSPSGLLASKTDALGRTVSQTYNVRGQSWVRTLARGVTATYAYSSTTGELTSIDYSDSTPDITYSYTRLGQLDAVTDAAGTRSLVYDTSKPWQLTAEALDSFYGSKVMTRLYETSGVVGRSQGFQLGSTVGSASDIEQEFGFAANGRFESIKTERSSGAATRTFVYGYEPDSTLVNALGLLGGGSFAVTRTFETNRDLVASVDSTWSGTSRVKYQYAYDDRGQRSSVVQSGTVFSDYGNDTHRIFAYNGRGELTADVGYLNGTPTSQTNPLPGRHHEYDYDNAGNRISSNRTGVSGLADNYTTNALNQYTSRENNTLPVSGTAGTGTQVAVQGRTVSAGRQGKYWHDEVTVNNANHPWYGSLLLYTLTVGGGGGGSDLYRSDSRNAWLAKALQSFTYDDDGNLTGDGVWDYTYDAENRLVRMKTTANAASYNFPNRDLLFKYDYMGRRIQKRVINVTTSTEISCRRFVYDGWNLVAEYEAPGGSSLGTLVRSYTWGLDIVSSLSSAGGVGALLQLADHASGKTYYPLYDANGNVAALLNSSTGNPAATYEYSPFGEPIRAEVAEATVADQPFRFSTMFTDVETGLVYYGKRYYDPRNGRFINRDPIEESGGVNLYGFCGNDSVNRWDFRGMTSMQDMAMERLAWYTDGYTFDENPGSYIDYCLIAAGSDGDFWLILFDASSGETVYSEYLYKAANDNPYIMDPFETTDSQTRPGETDPNDSGGYDGLIDQTNLGGPSDDGEQEIVDGSGGYATPATDGSTVQPPENSTPDPTVIPPADTGVPQNPPPTNPPSETVVPTAPSTDSTLNSGVIAGAITAPTETPATPSDSSGGLLDRLGNGLIGAGTGAVTGATTGGLTGAGVGSLAGGVGAGPGAIAGATVGAVVGAITGFFQGVFSDPRTPTSQVVSNAATSGYIAGAVGGAGGAISAAKTGNTVVQQASRWDTSITNAGARMVNVETNVTAQQFQTNLISNGFSVLKTTMGTNGPTTILTNGRTTYAIYIATSTGAASAEMRNAAGQVIKYRLR